MSSRITLAHIVDNVSLLSAAVKPAEFIYDFLASFGISKSIISRLKGGSINMAKKPGCTLLKDKIYFEPLVADLLKAVSPAQALAAAKADAKIKASKPRFLIATDFKTLAAFDTKKGETEEFPIADLHEHYAFFLPLAGMEKTVFQDEAEADVKAAEHMAKLYDLIRADNPPKRKEDRHALNVFLTRLLFCYFAEDTGIFEGEAMFTGTVEQCTQADGSDLDQFLAELFLLLNTEPKARAKTPQHLRDFKYVNGGLFNDTSARHSQIPKFTAKSRQKLIELGTKSWKEINPDIFGSMFQGVVDDEKRAELGMHYTSVPNIMKVIKPLFLDDLHEELEKAKGSESKLKKLQARLYKMRFFDPACGSGNFLIIAYKELRRFEMGLFRALDAVGKQSLIADDQAGFDAPGFRPAVEQQTLTFRQACLHMPGIHVSQFYGIELDDFAHEVAILALWLTEHQMNLEFKAAFGNAPPSLPLKDGAKVVCDNALRKDWEKVCPRDEGHEVFVMGNPPYLGSSLQDASQKADLAYVFNGGSAYKNLDYIAGWFLKAARYLEEGRNRCAFVTTNSICQGEQVAMLWPHIFSRGVEIGFAHLSFKWTNNAKNKAAVICVIIGLQHGPIQKKKIYSEGIAKTVGNINAYLVDAKNVIVTKRRKPVCHVRAMDYGSKPTDGGNLLLSKVARDELWDRYPELRNVIRPFVGAEDYIDGSKRYCLWLTDEDAKRFGHIPEIAKRLNGVREMRLASPKEPTQQDAEWPHRFSERRHEDAPSIIIPCHTSEHRNYIPFGYLDSNSVVANSALAIYHAEPWLFGIISSRMHMAWVGVVAGRIKTDFRYSNTLCYNNFPFPKLAPQQLQLLNDLSNEVLIAREKYFPKSLAQLYDPDTMPSGLLSAHQSLDLAVEKCYRDKPFTSDEERLEYLFALYEKMTAE